MNNKNNYVYLTNKTKNRIINYILTGIVLQYIFSCYYFDKYHINLAKY